MVTPRPAVCPSPTGRGTGCSLVTGACPPWVAPAPAVGSSQRWLGTGSPGVLEFLPYLDTSKARAPTPLPTVVHWSNTPEITVTGMRWMGWACKSSRYRLMAVSLATGRWRGCQWDSLSYRWMGAKSTAATGGQLPTGSGKASGVSGYRRWALFLVAGGSEGVQVLPGSRQVCGGQS